MEPLSCDCSLALQTAFSRHKQLGVVGGYAGTIHGGPLNGKYGTGATRIPYYAGDNGQKSLMFVTSAKAGPLVVRQDLFWETARPPSISCLVSSILSPRLTCGRMMIGSPAAHRLDPLIGSGCTSCLSALCESLPLACASTGDVQHELLVRGGPRHRLRHGVFAPELVDWLPGA